MCSFEERKLFNNKYMSDSSEIIILPLFQFFFLSLCWEIKFRKISKNRMLKKKISMIFFPFVLQLLISLACDILRVGTTLLFIVAGSKCIIIYSIVKLQKVSKRNKFILYSIYNLDLQKLKYVRKPS